VLENPRGRLLTFYGLGALDGSLLPLPLEPFVLPVLATHPRRAPVMALILLGGCPTGCLIFHLVGLAAGEALVEPLLRRFGLLTAFQTQLDPIRDNAFAAIFVIGLTPIPLHIGTLGAGVTGVDPLMLFAALCSRGARAMPS
jgi:membrane protein YqaA with SNARE-associated domain